MALGGSRVGEETSRLDDKVDAVRCPRQSREVTHGHDAVDLVAVDDQNVVLGEVRLGLLRGDLVLELAVDRVVLHLVGEVVRVGGDIDDGDDVDLVLAEKALVAEGLEDHAADTTETVDGNLDGHFEQELGDERY